MKKHIHASRAIVLISCVATGMLTSVLALVGPAADEASFLSYYTNLALGPLRTAFLTTVAFSCAAGFIYGGVLFLKKAVTGKDDPRNLFTRQFIVRTSRAVVRGLWDVLMYAGPVIVTFLFVTLSMAYINPVNATRLIDDQVIRVDHALTGVYPFIFLQDLHYTNHFLETVIFCFMNLPLILIVFSLYVLFFYRDTFHEMAAVFCLSLIVMIFFWQIFPVLSPHDRFLDNVYNLPNSPEITQALQNYHPQPLIAVFLGDARERKNHSLDGVMPTSTLPSAHVAWATLLAYYAYRTRKSLLIFLLPLAVFSTIGTVLLAQHYFIDLPAGFLVMVFSIWLVQLTEKYSV